MMNCRQATRLLPLWIGHDLADSREAEALRVHLTECNDCSLQHRRLQHSLETLQCISTASLAAAADADRGSLWPRLAMVLKEVPRARDQFNGWIPAAAMTLAVTLMVAVSIIQVRRDLGHPDPVSASGRNLFQTDSRFAAGNQDSRDLRIRGLVVQPANGRLPEDF